MKLAKWAVAGLIAATAALTGCSTQAGTTAQVVALQKQVAALSARVDKIEADKAALADFDAQTRCRDAADQQRRDDRAFWAGESKYFVTSATNFNNRLHACFVLEAFVYQHDTVIELDELPQGVPYASFRESLKGNVLRLCSVRVDGSDVPCKSNQQFHAAIAQYMGTWWKLDATPGRAQAARH